jgi:hypothetical protein
MCNAWNHPPGCTCGWGGDGHLGTGATGSHDLVREFIPQIRQFSYQERGLTGYHHENSDFCRPTHCPECGEDVFFVCYNGGSVWLDPPLGWPWPKHRHCNDSGSAGYKFMTDVQSRYLETEVKAKLARIIKRIYQHTFLIYLLEAHDGRLHALRAKRRERTVFTNLVSIVSTPEAIFLEDSRHIPVEVKNFKLTPEMLNYYLSHPDEIIQKPRLFPNPPLIKNPVWSIPKQRFV